MKIFVTGISGFVGHHLTELLLENKHEIHGLISGEVNDLDNRVKIYTGDIQDKDIILETIDKIRPEAIVHLAALAHVGKSFREPHEVFNVNLIGTLNLLEAVRLIKEKETKFNPRIITVGSAEEYGQFGNEQLPLEEETVLNPSSPYGISKAGVYYLAKMYVQTYGLDICHMRPFNHTGPGQRPGFFIPDMCAQVVEIENGRQEPKIKVGNIDTRRDISDVRDVVRGYLLVLEKGRKGEVYNICSGSSVQMRSILEMILKMAKKPIEQQSDPARYRPSDIPELYGENQKIREHTGWLPKIELERTLEDTLEWYRSSWFS